MTIPPMPIGHCIVCDHKKTHPVCYRKDCFCFFCNIFHKWLDSGKAGEVNG